MTAYIYDIETKEVIEYIKVKDQEKFEKEELPCLYDWDVYGMTYTQLELW